MDVIALLSIWLWRSEIGWRGHGCHVERGCETACLQGAPWHPCWILHFSAWGWVLVYCGYAEVLSCEKSYPGMYSFLHLRRFQLDWSSLVAALIFSGQFAAEWYVQIQIDVTNSWFGRSIWICCLQICICGDCFVVSLDVAVFAIIPVSLRRFWAGSDVH